MNAGFNPVRRYASPQNISICTVCKKICVEKTSGDETWTLVNLFNCNLLSFIHSFELGGGTGETKDASCINSKRHH